MRVLNRNRDLSYWADSFAYVGICILTLGVAFVIRVIISTAIRCAFENEGSRDRNNARGLPVLSTEKVLTDKEAQRLRKDEIVKVSVKDGLWACPICSEINRELQDACRKCGQEVDKT